MVTYEQKRLLDTEGFIEGLTVDGWIKKQLDVIVDKICWPGPIPILQWEANMRQPNGLFSMGMDWKSGDYMLSCLKEADRDTINLAVVIGFNSEQGFRSCASRDENYGNWRVFERVKVIRSNPSFTRIFVRGGS